MDTMKDTKMQPAKDAVIEELRKVIADCYWPTSPVAINEILDRLEAAEKERDNVKAAAENIALKLDYLRSKLETAENAQNDWLRANAPGGWIDNLRIENEALRAEVIHIKEVEFPRKAQAVADGWRGKCERLEAKIAEKEQPGAEWFDWLPQGTTHISSIRTVTIPCFGFEARFNAFKYIDGVLYTYRTDSDNEYGEWVKAASRYRNDVLPTVYPLSGAKGEEK